MVYKFDISPLVQHHGHKKWKFEGQTSEVGCLISDFNFTSKTLLVKVILLVKLDQHSKKDLVWKRSLHIHAILVTPLGS